MSSVMKSQLSTPPGLPWRKRRFEECEDESNEPKTKIAKTYYVLESESSVCSDDDTESVYSIQDKETDVVRDTTDTDTDWVSGEEDEANDQFEIEFSVASLSDNGQNPFITDEGSYSSNPDDVGGAGLVLADLCATAADADTSTCDELAMWADDTDVDLMGGEDVWGDNEDIICRRVVLTCMMCKESKPDPMLPYCEKCYQLRKSLFPPRPRRTRSRKGDPVSTSSIPTVSSSSTVSSTVLTLSQDSGVGGSQDLRSDSDQKLQFDIGLALNQIGGPSANNLNTPKLDIDLGLDKIIIPSGSRDKEASNSTLSTINLELDKIIVPPALMDSAVKDSVQVSKERLPWSEDSDKRNAVGKNITSLLNGAQSPDDMCIVCTLKPKNGIFVHGSIGHICCCYECARKVWARTKRCPACNCKVKNILKGFQL